jgi:hypothetical protein
MGLRVKDEGGSERRPVMGRTGVEPVATSLHAKAGRLPSGVDGRDPSANRRRGQSRSVGGIATIHAGAAPATATLISVAGTGNSNVQVDPKSNGAAASRKRCRGPVEPCPIVSRRGVVQCLSCMRRNGARAVLRGGGAGNSTSLPDHEPAWGCSLLVACAPWLWHASVCRTDAFTTQLFGCRGVRFSARPEPGFAMQSER